MENNEESKQKKNKISNSKDEIHHYWKSPWHENNLPDAYSEAPILRSQLLEELIKKYARPEFKILEFGCNVGRNLNYLFNAGYKNLTGIEISTNAVEQLNKKYPEMASHSKIYNAPIENIIKTFQDNEYDLVFTIAVFEHIHTDSEWIFPDVARITNNILITIEDEQTDSWRHFTRNYRNVFEPLGMEQLETIQCNKVLHSLSSSFFVRIFKKI
ncbi:MAG: hypothetical protein A2X47_12075 [Lentisphaerae bacterium GWF2_38_69]|nr:MAG: hypothetical protein A2X47_12075 [Lentisphaerae bacterium GWF2_38_69]